MQNAAIYCHACGEPALLVSQDSEFTLGGRTVVVADEFMRCTACATEFYLPGQMDATQRRAVAAARAAEGLLLPEEIRSIREALRLSQADFEQLLGVGPKTVIRWEKGTVFQNSATDTLLRLIRADRSNAELLARMHGIALPCSVVPMRAPTGARYVDQPIVAKVRPKDAHDFRWGGRALVLNVDLDEVSDCVGCP